VVVSLGFLRPLLMGVVGAVGFLSRVPVGRSEAHWNAFRTMPAAFPVAGYVVGAAVAVPFVISASLPAPIVALGFVVAVYAVTGINHVDGVADLGDAAVVHGDADRRREVMHDTSVGVGAVLAVAVTVAGLALAGLALAPLGLGAVGMVVACEVGAKAGMAALVCLGEAAHDGLGARLTAEADPRAMILPTAASLPALALTWPAPTAAVTCLVAVGTALAVGRWARRRLGGVSGDVFGAANELGRVAGLHAGVVTWALV
jgi:adenosylcobinamide-GDP ribazoletransferase